MRLELEDRGKTLIDRQIRDEIKRRVSIDAQWRSDRLVLLEPPPHVRWMDTCDVPHNSGDSLLNLWNSRSDATSKPVGCCVLPHQVCSVRRESRAHCER